MYEQVEGTVCTKHKIHDHKHGNNEALHRTYEH